MPALRTSGASAMAKRGAEIHNAAATGPLCSIKTRYVAVGTPRLYVNPRRDRSADLDLAERRHRTTINLRHAPRIARLGLLIRVNGTESFFCRRR